MVEARNPAGKIFGEEALTAAIQSTASMPPQDAAGEVVSAVQAWAPQQEDDLTILVCDYRCDLAATPA